MFELLSYASQLRVYDTLEVDPSSLSKKRSSQKGKNTEHEGFLRKFAGSRASCYSQRGLASRRILFTGRLVRAWLRRHVPEW